MIDPEKQLHEWLHGNPIHGIECTPDFSCCKPALLAPYPVRHKYYAAHLRGDTKTTSHLCFGFLAALLELEGHEVVSS